MPRNKRTYYFKVTLRDEDFARMLALVPEYDPEQCREITKPWWKGNHMQEENRRVSVHLNYLIHEDSFKQALEAIDGLPPMERMPSGSRPKWVVVELNPEMMAMSAKRARQLHSKANDFRHAVIRAIVLGVFGLIEAPEWWGGQP